MVPKGLDFFYPQPTSPEENSNFQSMPVIQKHKERYKAQNEYQTKRADPPIDQPRTNQIEAPNASDRNGFSQYEYQ
jgi:hypothetical protein